MGLNYRMSPVHRDDLATPVVLGHTVYGGISKRLYTLIEMTKAVESSNLITAEHCQSVEEVVTRAMNLTNEIFKTVKHYNNRKDEDNGQEKEDQKENSREAHN